MSDAAEPSLFVRLGGQPYFDALAARFYEGVADDPVLRPLYPDDPAAFAQSAQWLALFLGQYWGGPTTYSEHRGHPRLRARHIPFRIGEAERDAWLSHMRAAVEASEGVDPADLGELWSYLASAADFLRNA